MGNQKTTNSDFPRAIQIAQFRFGLISPVIQGLYPDSSRAEYYRRVTEEPLILPDGRSIQYKAKTIEKWVSLYNRGVFDALMPKERSDKGKTRVLSDDAIEQIYSLKTKI